MAVRVPQFENNPFKVPGNTSLHFTIQGILSATTRRSKQTHPQNLLRFRLTCPHLALRRIHLPFQNSSPRCCYWVFSLQRATTAPPANEHLQCTCVCPLIPQRKAGEGAYQRNAHRLPVLFCFLIGCKSETARCFVCQVNVQ